MAVSTLGYALLGMLAREPRSGYDLGRELKKPIGFFWHARYSQIYPELAKLEERGYIKHEVIEQQDLPDKKEYSITPEGREVLSQWITAPLEMPSLRDELVLKTYSLWMAEPQEAIKLFRTHERYHQEQLRHYQQLEQELQECGDDLDDVTSPYFAMSATLQCGLNYEQAYIDWCRWVLAKLEKAVS